MSERARAAAELGRRVRSFAYALRGLATLVRSQPNAWIHGAATAAAVGLAAVLALPRRDWALLVLAIASVWSAEAFNSALEALADRASPDYHPLVERAKDLAAAAVLLVAAGAAGVGLLVLGPPLWARLTG